METQKQILTICAACGSIRIDNKNELWLKKDDETDFKLYNLYMENSGRVLLSHGYCPEDFQKALEESEKYSK